MAKGIQASGFAGLAFETVAGTYVEPTKYFPLISESLGHTQATVWRRVVRQVADVLGGIPGNVAVAGDIKIEALEDVVPYFLHASRASVAKSGATDYTYVYTPSHAATAPNKTLSLTIVRNGVVFTYTGIIVSSQSWTVEDGSLNVTFTVQGQDEAVGTLPTPTFPTTIPFGAGQYNLQIPTATQIFDADTFTLDINDNAEHQYRLRNDTRGATFQKYGEREVTLSVERDFEDRADYDAYKALTAQGITIVASKSATRQISFKVPASIKDTYEVSGLAGQSDLVRASISYRGVYDAATSKAYEIEVKTAENII